MSKTIEIIVAPNGETKVETKGFAGSECQDASRFIEQALGRRTGEQTTVEFHAQPTDRATQERQGHR